jgi:PAS domain S-box-containing protein
VGGAALGSLAVAGVALAGLVTAPEGEAPEIAAFRLQIYLGVMAVCMLVLGAVVEDRAAAGRRLDEARQELDRLLRRRIREEREERDFGRLVLDTSRALVATLDPQGRLTTANPAFRALTLAGRETDLPGPTLLSLVPEDERPGVSLVLEQAWRADAPVAFELALESAAGERREFQWSARCLTDPEGQARLLVAGTEVTRRRQARREVERSLALVQTTLESIAEGIVVVPAGGGEATWNARFAGLWGIPVQPDHGPAALVFARLREQVADPGAWDDVLRRLDPTSALE